MIIGVFSAKGGVGKSLVASNLAAAFAAFHRLPTALLDLAPGLGQDDLLLDLVPERTWADLLPVISELTAKHLELAATVHPSGLRLFAAPPEINVVNPRTSGVNPLTPDLLKALLAALRQNFAHTVLDCPTGLEASTLAAFGEAELRLVVLTLDVPTLRSTQRLIQALPADEKATGLVINQYSRGTPIGLDEVLASLSKDLPREETKGMPRTEALSLRLSAHAEGLPVPARGAKEQTKSMPKTLDLYAVLPVDARAVWGNVSYGQPCVLAKKKGLGRALRLLAARIVRPGSR